MTLGKPFTSLDDEAFAQLSHQMGQAQDYAKALQWKEAYLAQKRAYFVLLDSITVMPATVKVPANQINMFEHETPKTSFSQSSERP